MDIVSGSHADFDEMYIYSELMEADLQAIVRCSTNLPSLSQLISVN
jgi:hypothetical protein